MTKKWMISAMGLALLLAFGCDGGAEQGELTQHSFPIINGVPASGGVYDAVVSLHQRSGDSVYPNIFCSGTLIAPDVVLTAAHCLNVGRRKPVTMSPDAVAIGFGQNPTTATPDRVFYPVSETWMHPAYSATALTDDIAMLRLALPNHDVTPVPFLPAALGFNAADEGQLALDFAGYGQDEDGNTNEKLHFVGTLDSIQSASQIYYRQPDGGPCFGDSGGPAFVVRGGKTYVGGMTSYGDSYCADYGVSTRADAYENLINDFVGVVAEPFCGDGECNGAETCESCAADCGACPVDPFCGDGECNGGETCESCAADCGACPVEPTCVAKGGTCDSHADCCSGSCHPRHHYCK